MKSKTPKKKPDHSIRDQVIAALLSEAGKQALRIIGAVAVTLIMRHGGDVLLVPQVLLV